MTTPTEGLRTLLAVYARLAQEAEDAWEEYQRLCDRDVPQETITAKGRECEALSAEADRVYDKVNAAYRLAMVAGVPSGS